MALEQKSPEVGHAAECISLLVPIVAVLSLMAYYCSSCTRHVKYLLNVLPTLIFFCREIVIFIDKYSIAGSIHGQLSASYHT